MTKSPPDAVLALLLYVVAPVAAGCTAFSASATTHTVNDLLASAMCGNGQHWSTLRVLGHCAGCWEAGAAGYLLALAAAIGVMRSLPRPALRPARSR